MADYKRIPEARLISDSVSYALPGRLPIRIKWSRVTVVIALLLIGIFGFLTLPHWYDRVRGNSYCTTCGALREACHDELFGISLPTTVRVRTTVLSRWLVANGGGTCRHSWRESLVEHHWWSTCHTGNQIYVFMAADRKNLAAELDPLQAKDASFHARLVAALQSNRHVDQSLLSGVVYGTYADWEAAYKDEEMTARPRKP